jgi:prepilin-type processing-associated H-X9-DG protein
MLSLDPASTALVLIDLQKGITAMPVAPHDTATVIGNSVKLGQRLAAAGGTIVLVNVAFADGHADRLKVPVDAPMPTTAHPPGWSDFAPEIAALPTDVIVTKRQWGAFHGTELDLQLRRRGVTTIILGGIATNFGVESTAREAWQHNYAVIVAEDATTTLSHEMHSFALQHVLPRISRIRSTADILAALPAEAATASA